MTDISKSGRVWGDPFDFWPAHNQPGLWVVWNWKTDKYSYSVIDDFGDLVQIKGTL